ncbi:uncharacterized protein LOC134742088 [Cydia strobilella]|uniref:uncharacterized protein LOC134742088 n=1 Tax=Cydia strobilella TaxID=1100964 RepID=UPI003006C455
MHISSPTRINACIDQIASNVDKVKAYTHQLCLSDHDMAQTITFSVKRKNKCLTWFDYKRDFNKGNIAKFIQCISALSFSEVLFSSDLTEAFTLFYELVCLFHDLCFPVIKVKMNNRYKKSKWLTKGIRKSCYIKRKLYLRYKLLKTNKSYNRTQFKNYNNVLKKCIIKSQKINNINYISSNKNKCKATWDIISANLSSANSYNEIDSLNFNNATFNNPKDICNLMNDYFINITVSKSNVNSNNVRNVTNTIDNYSSSIFLRPVDAKEVFKIIMSLKNSRSSGYDDITTYILKLIAPWICQPIAHIINLSFDQAVFPEQLKLSVVKPLFKKGDRKDPNNYRPITIVPVISKIIEKAMCERLTGFLEKNGLLQAEQYGFRRGHSTELACFDLVKYVSESLNSKIPILSIFLDLSKALNAMGLEELHLIG